MKCKECEYHTLVGGTYFCDAIKGRTSRINTNHVELDLPCSKYDKRKDKEKGGKE